MKRPILYTLLLSLSALHTFAQVPERIHWQAFLTDDSGNPIEGSVDLAIRLYPSKSGGTATYVKDTTGVDASGGVVDVPLGPLSEVSFAGPLYVGVSVNGGAELVPRTALGSVPYALSLRGMRIEPADDGVSAGVNMIGGASNNDMDAGVVGGTISGGGGNADGESAPNLVTADFGTVGGGFGNQAGGSFGATVGGGGQNSATGGGATVGGGNANEASGVGSTTAGGSSNKVEGDHGSIGGGLGNTAGAAATIGGGEGNTADGGRSTIGGGSANAVAGTYATVGGGDTNAAGGSHATVGGGERNTASGDNGAVAGGSRNSATGYASAVPGGGGNTAGGHFSMAAGHQAQVRSPDVTGDEDGDEGTFVWSDDSNPFARFESTGPNQFLVRAAGGVGIGTNQPGAQLTVHGNVKLDSVGAKLIFPDGTEQATAGAADGHSLDAHDGSPIDALYVDDNGNVGIGTTAPEDALHVEGDGRFSGGDISLWNGTSAATLRHDSSQNTYLSNRTNFAGNGATAGGTLNLHGETGVTLRYGSDGAAGLAGLHIEWAEEGDDGAVNIIVGPDNTLGTGVYGATISGGGGVTGGGTEILPNKVFGIGGTIGGGFGNQTGVEGVSQYSGREAVVSGGIINVAGGARSTIGGGIANQATGGYATIAGGAHNEATGDVSTVGGGIFNVVSGYYSTVGGGESNEVAGTTSTVGGGRYNVVQGQFGTIGGGGPSQGVAETGNRVHDDFGVVGGGGGNRAGSDDGDSTTHPYATVSGGKDNTASGEESVVSGGNENLASGRRSSVGGGVSNEATAGSSTVAGGFDNTASNVYATVGGGNANRATGNASTIPGGFSNEATALHSFAAGFDAHAVHEKTFVWNDGQRHSPLASENPYEFWVGAGGGAIFEAVVRPGSDNVFSLGLAGKRWTVVYATEGTINTSDARLKRNVEPIPYGLDAVMALDPVRYTWADRPEAGPRLGLLAQDTEVVVPEVVRAPGTDADTYGLSYAELVPVLIRAIQEQQVEIENLREQVALLRQGEPR